MSGNIQVRQNQSKVKLKEVLKDLGVVEIANCSATVLKLLAMVGIATSTLTSVATALPLVGFGKKWIDSYQKQKNRKLTSAEFVALTAPFSYCQSFEELKISLTLPEEIQPDSALLEFEVNEELAKEAITCFHKSTLGRAYNTVLARFLKEGGLKEIERKIIAGWVGWKTEAYLAEAVEEAGEQVDGVGRSYSIGREKESLYQRIQDYGENTIQKLPLEPVLGEEEFVLEKWVKERLQEDSGKAMFILGGPGSGKTVFCRLFAYRVWEHLHPGWVPIFLRLRRINNFAGGLEEILAREVASSLGKDWLKDDSQRYLIFLDGFDELRMEGREFGAERFLRQVISFSQNTHHGIILTGRPLAFQTLNYSRESVAEATILPMDDSLQNQWLANWQVLVGREKREGFEKFLRGEICPQTIQEELAREPLLLYLLAAMHRDDKIKGENLASLGDKEGKIEIYNQSLEWVLTKQRPEELQKDLTRLSGKELEQVLMSAAIAVVQSGGEYGKIAAVKERLGKFYPYLLDEIAKMGDDDEQEEGLKNAFAAFYLKSAGGGAVEFFHKSFGEFLCGKTMEQSFSQWVKPGDRNQLYHVSEEELAGEIYDLFGYGSLTQEIIDYLFGLLERNQEFAAETLFQRLQDFYFRWCEGEYIDEVFPEEILDTTQDRINLPQQKMLQLRNAQPELGDKITWGVRQVDIYTGLNVMILLLELQRYGKRHDLHLSFHLCGEVNKDGKPKDKDKLSRIISYSDGCLRDSSFFNIVGAFLSGANLNNANLKNAHLQYANLQYAHLQYAHLQYAHLQYAHLQYAHLQYAHLQYAHLQYAHLQYAHLQYAHLQYAHLQYAHLQYAHLQYAHLQYAHLYKANLYKAHLQYAHLQYAHLKNANLENANLENANLENANLYKANLENANLYKANLYKANLKNANLENANLKNAHLQGIKWNEETKWGGVIGLETARNVPEELKRQLQ